MRRRQAAIVVLAAVLPLVALAACSSFQAEPAPAATDGAAEAAASGDGSSCPKGGRGGDASLSCGDVVCTSGSQSCCYGNHTITGCAVRGGGDGGCPSTQWNCLSKNDCYNAGEICCRSSSNNGTGCNKSCSNDPQLCATDDECKTGEFCAPPEGLQLPWYHCKACPP